MVEARGETDVQIVRYTRVYRAVDCFPQDSKATYSQTSTR